MRSDFDKVLVERPRLKRGDWLGGGKEVGFRQRLAHIADEVAPSKISMKVGHENRKWLNENLAPLKRFLRSNVGRPWEKVYSEICAGIDRRNVVQAHIFEHLFGFVETRVRAVPSKNGKYTVFQVLNWQQEWVPIEDRGTYFFVDPRTGILRENVARVTSSARTRERQAAIAREAIFAIREISDFEELHPIDGYWYRILFRVAAKSDPNRYWDVLRGKERHRNSSRYAYSKQRLSNREVRDLNLPALEARDLEE
jgi:hypothetical protein